MLAVAEAVSQDFLSLESLIILLIILLPYSQQNSGKNFENE